MCLFSDPYSWKASGSRDHISFLWNSFQVHSRSLILVVIWSMWVKLIMYKQTSHKICTVVMSLFETFTSLNASKCNKTHDNIMHVLFSFLFASLCIDFFPSTFIGGYIEIKKVFSWKLIVQKVFVILVMMWCWMVEPLLFYCHDVRERFSPVS